MGELNLDLTLASVPKTVSHFLNEVSLTKDSSMKLSMLDDLVRRLEEEMNKVLAFKRELPLCILLVNDAIARLKDEKEKVRLIKMRDPVLMNEKSDNKMNWMSSVQLWTAQTKSKNEDGDRSVLQKSNGGGVFMSFNENTRVPLKEVSQVPSFSLMSEVSHGNSKSGCDRSSSGSSLLRVEIQNQQPQPPQPLLQGSRKQRRSWSSELHRRFVDALQQLGGAHATPKQIREKMQVDGLTNDEVKSHLQKYRLHVRRFPVSSIEEANKLALYMIQDQCGDTPKGNLSESVSPQGPLTPILIGGSAKGLSSTVRNSVDAEDEQSDCRNWKDDQEQQHEAE
ncbi:transcription factor HHO5 isoform X2 [Vicia villosa]|uniref:transcription factor HHO5 isoform X2 n=1 Tax=Vicia villosa TaxID=3911 RepID=UPI00273C4DBB|nr:transcription factor HHO5 isoform X2 [Vicia villosa]